MDNPLIKTLLTTDIGLLSLLTIVFVLGMAVYIFCFVRRQIRIDTARRAAEQQEQTASHG